MKLTNEQREELAMIVHQNWRTRANIVEMIFESIEKFRKEDKTEMTIQAPEGYEIVRIAPRGNPGELIYEVMGGDVVAWQLKTSTPYPVILLKKIQQPCPEPDFSKVEVTIEDVYGKGSEEKLREMCKGKQAKFESFKTLLENGFAHYISQEFEIQLLGNSFWHRYRVGLKDWKG
jgi:hypothetical protein